MRDMTFGQYYPGNSIVHRLDPRAKFMFMVMYMVAVFFVTAYVGYAVVALFLLTAVLAARVPLRLMLKSLRAVIFLVVFTAILNVFFYIPEGEPPLASWWIFTIYSGGLHYAAKMILRLVLLIIGPTLLTLTTSPMQLTDAIESILSPLKLIRFPAHELAMIISLALGLIPTIMDETDKIIKAQKARGADFESGNIIRRARALIPILIPLFVSSFRRADELALAMDSRCYNGGRGRTKLRVMHYRLIDLLGLLFFAALMSVTLLLRYNWFGWQFISSLI